MAARSFSQLTTENPANFEAPADNNYEKYMRAESDSSRREYTYALLGSPKFLTASAGRLIVVKLLATMTASADVLAVGTTEVPLADIAEGTTATVKFRGKPVFIRHRTAEEVAESESTPMDDLKDPEADSDRVRGDPKWLVVLGVCTHLGCVPLSNAGAYKGWFCPCHGSHYDISGRIRKGPAPLNLEVPPYKFMDEENVNLLIG